MYFTKCQKLRLSDISLDFLLYTVQKNWKQKQSDHKYCCGLNVMTDIEFFVRRLLALPTSCGSAGGFMTLSNSSATIMLGYKGLQVTEFSLMW